MSISERDQGPTVPVQSETELGPHELALVKAAQALEPFAALGGIMAFGRNLPDDTSVMDIRGMGSPFPALTRGMFKDAYRANRRILRLLEKAGKAPPRVPVLREAPEAMIAAVAARAVGAGDLIEEAALSLAAAREVGGADGWRDLYAAYWDTAHPQPAPIEPGVLQAGDRVVQFGREGLRNGPATVMAVIDVPGLGGPPDQAVEYLFDTPAPQEDGTTRPGAAVMGRALLHLRDWPLGFLGFDVAEYVKRPGRVPGYVPSSAFAGMALSDGTG